MEGRRSSLLLRANREIAEVREELTKADLKLDEIQERNASLLEESSVLDSEVTRHCARTATSEQRLAQLFEEKSQSRAELEAQKASREVALAGLRHQNLQCVEALGRIQAAVAEDKLHKEELSAELARIRRTIEPENETLASVRRAREEFHASTAQQTAFPPTEAERKLQEQVKANEEERVKKQHQISTTRKLVLQLQSEISAEATKREQATSQLRKAECSEASARLKSLEATVAAQGGDVTAILQRASVGTTASPVASAESRLIELRRELAESEEQTKSFEDNLKKSSQRDSEVLNKLQSDLDMSRSDLQRSMREAAQAHGNEVANLEAEIQAERFRANTEAFLESECADRLKLLSERRCQDLEHQASLKQQSQLQAEKCSALRDELIRIKSQVAAVEQEIQERRVRTTFAEQRHSLFKADGDRRAAQVKSMIYELWHHLGVSPANK